MKKTLICLSLIACALVTRAQIKRYNENGKTYLEINNATTYDVIVEVAKQYKVKLTLQNTTKDKLFWGLSGTFPLDTNIRVIMEVIKVNTDINYTVDNKNLLVGFTEKK